MKATIPSEAVTLPVLPPPPPTPTPAVAPCSGGGSVESRLGPQAGFSQCTQPVLHPQIDTQTGQTHPQTLVPLAKLLPATWAPGVDSTQRPPCPPPRKTYSRIQMSHKQPSSLPTPTQPTISAGSLASHPNIEKTDSRRWDGDSPSDSGDGSDFEPSEDGLGEPNGERDPSIDLHEDTFDGGTFWDTGDQFDYNSQTHPAVHPSSPPHHEDSRATPYDNDYGGPQNNQVWGDGPEPNGMVLAAKLSLV